MFLTLQKIYLLYILTSKNIFFLNFMKNIYTLIERELKIKKIFIK